MKQGIIGLPQSGKTTVFNALTSGHKPVGHIAGGGRVEVNQAVVSVPDERVDGLHALFPSKKPVYAQVAYADVAGLEEGAGRQGFSGALLNQLAAMDGLIHVVRAFENPAVAHPGGTVDPARDVRTVETELVLNDLVTVEGKLERLADELRKGGGRDKGIISREQALCTRLHETLSAAQPLRGLKLTPDEDRFLSSFAFLSRKPLLTVLNLGDDDPEPAETYAAPQLALRGRLEMEIAQLPPEEAGAFLVEYGIAEPGLRRMIRLSYALLGLQSFLTIGDDEVRAWTVRRGATAVEAAGQVHTDMQHGFIRAEVFSYDDLRSAGDIAGVKARGQLRLEGKDYVVQDGDILNIRFSPPTR